MKKICLLCLAILSVSVLMAQPVNDDACAPIMLTIGDDCSGTLPYDNTGATAQVGESVGECYGDGSVEQTVWFAFVAPNTGAVSVNTDFANSGMQDNQLTVYNLEGGDCTVLPNFVEIACNEDRIPGAVNTEFNAALPPFPVTAGQTYYIQVDGYYADDGDDTTNDTSEGSFCIVVDEVTTPLNDDCANPDVYGGFGPSCTKVWGDDDIENVSTIGATAGDDIDVFSCDGSEFNASVYYSFNAGVAEVEFNLLSGENINVSLLTNPDAGCGSAVEVTGNCFTGINASDLADPMEADVLFTNLTPQTSYLMAIWTEEGDETDFSFCLTRAPAYSCGDGVCYDLAESYTDCPSDCPCISSVDLYSYITGDDTTTPEAVCPEIVGDLTDPDNPGLYIPFTITTNDNDLSGSAVTSTVGSLFTSSTPPTPLPDGEATNFLIYLFVTEAELTAGGNVTIAFGSDDGACDASVTFAMTDLIRPQTSECGGCDLNIVPDYAAATCDGTSVQLTLAVENGIGPNVWIDQTGTTSYTAPPNGDILVALDGSTSIAFPTNDLTLIAYDEGKPNCAVRITYTSGDYVCPGDPEDGICYEADGPALACRLDPEVAEVTCAGAIIDVGSETGTVNFSPDGIVSVDEEGNYVAAIDQNNCQPIDITITDDSTCDQTPIVTIISPASVAGGITVSTNAEDWGVQIADTLPICGTPGAFSGVFAVLDDGDTAGGQLTDFCEPTPPDLPAQSVCDQISGKIAMIDRGQCNFTQKVENAQNCGAIGVVICNCQPGPGWCAADDDVLITMAAGALENEITIPAVFMLYSDCQAIKAEMNNGNEVSACIGAPETIAGCTREFTLDVCDQLPPPEDCGPITGCTDMCDANYDPAAEENDPAACAGYDTTCDDSDCTTLDSYNTETCMCVNEAQTPPDCDDSDCTTADSYDTATCMCVNEAQTPPDCNDNDCTTIDSYDATTCMCVNEAQTPPDCDDSDCTTEDSYDTATCECVNTAIDPPSCDDSDCTTEDSYDAATCECVNTAIDPPSCDDDDCNTEDSYDTATCECVNAAIDPPSCDDSDCTTEDSYDAATCECVNTAIDPPSCDDDDCNTEDSYDTATCECVNTAIDPPSCDDGICGTEDSYDTATCECVNTVIDPPVCDDGVCSNGVETYNAETCMCEDGVPGEIPTCDDGDCNTEDSYDEANCVCLNTPIDPPSCDDGDCNTEDSYDLATCECVNTAIDPPSCDDGDCNTEDSYDAATCECVNTAIDPPSCDDGICGTEDSYDSATCECVNTPIDPPVCDDGDCSNGVETYNAETCMCEDGVPGEEPVCDDGDCSNGVETYDAANCECVPGEAPVVPDCDDGDCSNGVETYDTATCECVAGEAPVDPGCDDGDCSNGVETWDGCECVAGEAPVDPGCDDGDCSNGVETWNGCECVDGVAGETPDCDDSNCNTEDSYDEANCACVNTPIDPPNPDDGCDVTDDAYDEATCTVTNTPNCAAGTTYDAANCACTTDALCDDPCAPNYEANEACETYSTDCNTDCAAGDIQVWDATSCGCVTETVSVVGCTDSSATNYDPNANCDSGCEFEECTPPSAGDFNCDE